MRDFQKEEPMHCRAPRKIANFFLRFLKDCKKFCTENLHAMPLSSCEFREGWYHEGHPFIMAHVGIIFYAIFFRSV
jgi:hypothetical protein